MRGKAN